MRVLNTLPQADLRTTTASAIASEAAGYDGLLTMENKHDPFLAHALAAVSTDRVELGTFKHTDVSYSITLLQCMPFVKYTADSAVIGLGLRGKGLLDKIPFINSLFYTIVIEKKKYLHTYLTACSSR